MLTENQSHCLKAANLVSNSYRWQRLLKQTVSGLMLYFFSFYRFQAVIQDHVITTCLKTYD